MSAKKIMSAIGRGVYLGLTGDPSRAREMRITIERRRAWRHRVMQEQILAEQSEGVVSSG